METLLVDVRANAGKLRLFRKFTQLLGLTLFPSFFANGAYCIALMNSLSIKITLNKCIALFDD